MKYCKDCKYSFENLENIEYVCTYDDNRFISISRRTEACEHFKEKLPKSSSKENNNSSNKIMKIFLK